MKFPTGQGYYYSQNASICIYIYLYTLFYAILNNKVFSGNSKEFISYIQKSLEEDGNIPDFKETALEAY